MRLASVLVSGCVAGGLIFASAVAHTISVQKTAASGAQAFAACRACHTLHKGEANGLGPNLFGLFGRRAGATTGFAYSPALKASKLIWSEAALSEFLASPPRKVPDTRMPVAVPDPAKRAVLIAYLKGETSK